MPRIDLANGKVASGASPPQPVTPPGRKLSNWLLAYGEYTQESEAATDYHLWVGLVTLAGAVQRKVRLARKHGDLFVNLYMILVGEPGTYKSTALRYGENLLKDVPGIYIAPREGSAAGINKALSEIPLKEHQSMTAYASELSSLLGSDAMTIAKMTDYFTDLYDGIPDRGKVTISRGSETVPRPWFNLGGGTTKRWLGDHIPDTAVEGGFISRTIFVSADEAEPRYPFPEEDPEWLKLKRLLINDLTHISTLSGPILFEPEARTFYANWYLNKRARMPSIIDSRTRGYFQRKPDHVLKVAALLSVAERDDLTIERRDIEAALALLRQIEPGMVRAFSSVGRNIFATDIERILDQIKGSGKLSYGQLVRVNYHALEKRRLDEILAQLVSMGEIDLLRGGFYSVGGEAQSSANTQESPRVDNHSSAGDAAQPQETPVGEGR